MVQSRVATEQITEFLAIARLNCEVFKGKLEAWEVNFYYDRMLEFGTSCVEARKYIEHYNKRNIRRIH